MSGSTCLDEPFSTRRKKKKREKGRLFVLQFLKRPCVQYATLLAIPQAAVQTHWKGLISFSNQVHPLDPFSRTLIHLSFPIQRGFHLSNQENKKYEMKLTLNSFDETPNWIVIPAPLCRRIVNSNADDLRFLLAVLCRLAQSMDMKLEPMNTYRLTMLEST